MTIRQSISFTALLLTGALFAGAAANAALAAQPARHHGATPILASALPPIPVALPQPPMRAALQPELTLSRDVVAFGDLISGLPADLAATPAFRAPGLGETGTIQVARIMESARNAGIIREASEIESHGLTQVVVTRAARRITASDLEAAVKTGLQERFNVDARALALSIDGGAPGIAIEPELSGPVTVVDLGYDARTRRIQARLTVPGSVAMRLKPVTISGQLVETVEVVVPRRAISRGETLGKADVAIERRPRDGSASNAEFLADMRGAVDKVARRTLPAGMPLRANDVQREEIVAKGDLVTIVYESPGMTITMRGKAGESGAMGDVVSVTNPQSKRVLQGTVSGPGRVSVRSSAAGRVASAQ